jgi:hypothetical protein
MAHESPRRTASRTVLHTVPLTVRQISNKQLLPSGTRMKPTAAHVSAWLLIR